MVVSLIFQIFQFLGCVKGDQEENWKTSIPMSFSPTPQRHLRVLLIVEVLVEKYLILGGAFLHFPFLIMYFLLWVENYLSDVFLQLKSYSMQSL